MLRHYDPRSKRNERHSRFNQHTNDKPVHQVRKKIYAAFCICLYLSFLSMFSVHQWTSSFHRVRKELIGSYNINKDLRLNDSMISTVVDESRFVSVVRNTTQLPQNVPVTHELQGSKKLVSDRIVNIAKIIKSTGRKSKHADAVTTVELNVSAVSVVSEMKTKPTAISITSQDSNRTALNLKVHSPRQNVKTARKENSKKSKIATPVKNTYVLHKGEFYNETVVNPRISNFTYVNSDLCQRNHTEKVFLLCIVLSAPDEGERRAAIRRTWGNVTKVLNRRIATIFLLAKSTDEKLEKQIAKENDMHHDICKEDFIDSYDNLTLKTLMGLRWAERFCNEAKYILKIDSDTIPNIRNLVEHLEKAPGTKFVEGHVWKSPEPERGKKDKWRVPLSAYRYPIYPDYPNGPSYIISGDLLDSILNISAHVAYYKLEDVYIGMILHTLGVAPQNNDGYTETKIYFIHKNARPKSLCYFCTAFSMRMVDTVTYFDRFWNSWNSFDSDQCTVAKNPT